MVSLHPNHHGATDWMHAQWRSGVCSRRRPPRLLARPHGSRSFSLDTNTVGVTLFPHLVFPRFEDALAARGAPRVARFLVVPALVENSSLHLSGAERLPGGAID